MELLGITKQHRGRRRWLKRRRRRRLWIRRLQLQNSCTCTSHYTLRTMNEIMLKIIYFKLIWHPKQLFSATCTFFLYRYPAIVFPLPLYLYLYLPCSLSLFLQMFLGFMTMCVKTSLFGARPEWKREQFKTPNGNVCIESRWQITHQI